MIAAMRQIDSGNDVAWLVCIAFALLLASPVSWTRHWIWAVVALLVLVHAHRRFVAGLLGTIFVIGPMWFTPCGDLLGLSHNWWQAAACVPDVFVGLAFVIDRALPSVTRKSVPMDPGQV